MDERWTMWRSDVMIDLSFDMIDVSECEVSGDEEEDSEAPQNYFVDGHIADRRSHSVYGHNVGAT